MLSILSQHLTQEQVDAISEKLDIDFENHEELISRLASSDFVTKLVSELEEHGVENPHEIISQFIQSSFGTEGLASHTHEAQSENE
jgi:hypothetical protein